MSSTEDRNDQETGLDGRLATTRRQFLRQAMGMMGGAALAQILAACGSQAPAGSAAATAAPVPTAAASVATAAPAPTAQAAATAAPEAATAAPAAASGGGKITLGSFADPAQDVLKKVFLPEFEKQTGIKTEWVEADYSGWFQKAVNDGQTKAGAFDVYVLDDPWIPQFAGGGFLANMEELGYQPDSDYVQPALDLGYWPPKTGPRQPGIDPNAKPAIYALPIIGDVQLLFYRNDIYTSGPPATWDDVLKTAKEKADPSKQQYGWVTRGVKGNPIVTSFFVILHDFGGKMFEDNWKIAFNNPQGVEALEFYLSLLPYEPPGVAEFDSDQEGQTMLGGNAFAATMWTGWCRQTDDPSKSKVIGKVSFDVPPKKVNQFAKIGLFSAGIAASAPNKDGALKFFQWFNSSDTQVKFAQAGGTPVKISAFQNEDAVKQARWLPAILKALSAGMPSPRTPDWSKVEDILGTALNKALVENGNAKQHLDEAAAEATTYLKSAGYPVG
ncbi:MAG TPA: extracellular solute-binding protein [Roseiflexaceae bacterium]